MAKSSRTTIVISNYHINYFSVREIIYFAEKSRKKSTNAYVWLVKMRHMGENGHEAWGQFSSLFWERHTQPHIPGRSRCKGEGTCIPCPEGHFSLATFFLVLSEMCSLPLPVKLEKKITLLLMLLLFWMPQMIFTVLYWVEFRFDMYGNCLNSLY